MATFNRRESVDFNSGRIFNKFSNFYNIMAKWQRIFSSYQITTEAPSHCRWPSLCHCLNSSCSITNVDNGIRVVRPDHLPHLAQSILLLEFRIFVSLEFVETLTKSNNYLHCTTGLHLQQSNSLIFFM